MVENNLPGTVADIQQPYNEDMEEALLGSLLINDGAIVNVSSIIKPDDFYIIKNGWIYEAILNLYNEKTPSDLLLVYQKIVEHGHGDEILPGQLTRLLNACPTSMHATFYAENVKMLADRRKLIDLAGKVARKAFDLTCGMEDMSSTLKKIVNSIETSSLKVKDIQANIDDQQNKTHWLWPGRIPYGEITAIGGAEGTGKTWLLLEIIRRCLNGQQMPDGSQPNIRSNTIIYIDSEDGEKTISTRLRNWQASGLIKDKDIGNKLIFIPYPKDGLLDFAQLNYQQDLYSIVLKYQPYLIVLDSWQASLLKSTYDEQVMPTFLFFKRLIKQFGCAMITSFHFSKDSGVTSPYDSPSTLALKGAGNMRYYMRATYLMHRHAANKHVQLPTDPYIMKAGRVTDAPMPAPLAFKLTELPDDCGGSKLEFVDYNELAQFGDEPEPKSKLEEIKEHILTQLKEHGERQTKELMGEFVRMSVNRAINELIIEGKIEKVSHGRYALAM